jgi:hypothetical protein
VGETDEAKANLEANKAGSKHEHHIKNNISLKGLHCVRSSPSWSLGKDAATGSSRKPYH